MDNTCPDDVVAIVNFQGFTFKKLFIVQEVAVITVDGTFIKYVLKPHNYYSYSNVQNNSVFKNTNHIHYQFHHRKSQYTLNGVMGHLQFILKKYSTTVANPRVAIKGVSQQAIFLRQYNIPFFNLDSINCAKSTEIMNWTGNSCVTNFKNNLDHCTYHSSFRENDKNFCAATKVFAYCIWLGTMQNNKNNNWRRCVEELCKYKLRDLNSSYQEIKINCSNFSDENKLSNYINSIEPDNDMGCNDHNHYDHDVDVVDDDDDILYDIDDETEIF